MNKPFPRHTVQTDTAIAHFLHRDYETRSEVDLRKVGAHAYAAHQSTQILCVAWAVDDEPVRLWRPKGLLWHGDPIPPEWFEAAANPNWRVVAHNDQFESAIEQHILHPRHGFPLVPGITSR
jgi:DNA polymerase